MDQMTITWQKDPIGAVLLELALGITVLMLIVGGMLEFAVRMRDRQESAEFSRQMSRAISLAVTARVKQLMQSEGKPPYCCNSAALEDYYRFDDLVNSVLRGAVSGESQHSLTAVFGYDNDALDTNFELTGFMLPVIGSDGMELDEISCSENRIQIMGQNQPVRIFRYRIRIPSRDCLFCQFVPNFSPGHTDIVGEIPVVCSDSLFAFQSPGSNSGSPGR